MTFSASVLKPRIRKYIPAPILSWRMNETSGPVSDYSGNGYTGRVDGTPTRDVAMGNGNSGIQLTASGHGVSLDPTTLSPVINAIRTGSYSQSIVIRNMGWSGAHSPIPFVIWQSSSAGREVTLFIDYVQGAAGPDWVHRAGWDSASARDIGNLSFSYAPSSFDSQTFLLTYVWDDVTRTKSLYRDGVLVTSAVLGTDYPVQSPSSERMQVGGHLNFPGSYQYYGKISDLNIWDVALTSDEVATLASLQGRTPDQRTNIDPYAANVVSLLHFNGADGSTTFTDETGKVWTSAGLATISTVQGKFGGASAAFTNTAANANGRIKSPHSVDFDLSEADFTVEAWVYNTATAGNQTIVGKDGVYDVSFPSWAIIINGSRKFGLFVGSGTGTSSLQMMLSTASVALNAWTHVAAVRFGTTVRLFIDGVLDSTHTITATITDGEKEAYIGDYTGNIATADGRFLGYIDDVRITKGVARYTANFTPPSAEFPNP